MRSSDEVVRPAVLASTLGLVGWVQQLVLNTVAETGFAAIDDAVALTMGAAGTAVSAGLDVVDLLAARVGRASVVMAWEPA